MKYVVEIPCSLLLHVEAESEAEALEMAIELNNDHYECMIDLYYMNQFGSAKAAWPKGSHIWFLADGLPEITSPKVVDREMRTDA